MIVYNNSEQRIMTTTLLMDIVTGKKATHDFRFSFHIFHIDHLNCLLLYLEMNHFRYCVIANIEVYKFEHFSFRVHLIKLHIYKNQ